MSAIPNNDALNSKIVGLLQSAAIATLRITITNDDHMVCIYDGYELKAQMDYEAFMDWSPHKILINAGVPVK